MINIIDKIKSSPADIVGEVAKAKLDTLLSDQRFVWFTSAGGNLIQTAQLADRFVYKLAGVETPAGFIATPQPMHILELIYKNTFDKTDEENLSDLITKALVYANGVVILIQGLQQEIILLMDKATCEATDIPYNVIDLAKEQS